MSKTGIANGVPFLVHFRETVRSLEAGAPVLVRGMRMGAVREVKVTFDPATSSFAIPVVIELDPAPFITGEANEAAATPVHQAIAAMVRVGLRAELAAANLVPGTLAVALEIRPEAAPAELRRVASESRDATRPMLATRGRASFLGERSIGHYDPGATSSCLLIHAVCDVLEPIS